MADFLFPVCMFRRALGGRRLKQAWNADKDKGDVYAKTKISTIEEV